MNDLLHKGGETLVSLLRRRTGFFELGPTYAQLLGGAIVEYLAQRFEERSVVREAEKFLAEVNNRQRMP